MSIYFADCPRRNCAHLYQRIGDPCKGCGHTIPGEVIPIPVTPPRGQRGERRMTAEDVAEIKACLEPCDRCGEIMSSDKILKRFSWLTGSTLSRIRTGYYDHWLDDED